MAILSLNQTSICSEIDTVPQFDHSKIIEGLQKNINTVQLFASFEVHPRVNLLNYRAEKRNEIQNYF